MSDAYGDQAQAEDASRVPPAAPDGRELGRASVRLDIAIPLPEGYLSAAYEFESLGESATSFAKGLRVLEKRGWSESSWDGYPDGEIEMRVYRFERADIAECDALADADAAEAAGGGIEFSEFQFDHLVTSKTDGKVETSPEL